MGQVGRETILHRCDPERRAGDLARLYREISQSADEMEKEAISS